MRLAALALAFLFATPALATPITFRFAGTVTEIPGTSSHGREVLRDFSIDVGTPFSGSFTFDTSPDEVVSDPNRLTTFLFRDSDFEVRVGLLIISMKQFAIRIWNDTAFGGSCDFPCDVYEVVSSGPFEADILLRLVDLSFVDPTAIVLSDTELLLEPPDIDRFATELRVSMRGSDVQIRGTVETIVPEPAPLTLLTVGLLAIARVYRRRRVP